LVRNEELLMVENDFNETLDADGLDRSWNQTETNTCSRLHVNQDKGKMQEW